MPQESDEGICPYLGRSSSSFDLLDMQKSALKLEHIQFVDTGSKFEANNLMPHNGLVNMESTGHDGNWVPKLDEHEQPANSQNWWNGKKVIADGMKQTKPETKQISFTRGELVKLVAETDGGAHVDPAINTDYHKLRNENLMGWFYGKEGVPLQNPVPPCIRQIAFEALATFGRIDILLESKLP
jgi:hypothetical protein